MTTAFEIVYSITTSGILITLFYAVYITGLDNHNDCPEEVSDDYMAEDDIYLF